MNGLIRPIKKWDRLAGRTSTNIYGEPNFPYYAMDASPTRKLPGEIGTVPNNLSFTGGRVSFVDVAVCIVRNVVEGIVATWRGRSLAAVLIG